MNVYMSAVHLPTFLISDQLTVITKSVTLQSIHLLIVVELFKLFDRDGVLGGGGLGGGRRPRRGCNQMKENILTRL